MLRAFPFASALALTALAFGCASTPIGTTTGPELSTDKEAIAHVLDSLHEAAAHADGPRYFSLFAPEAVFLGTDATERWTLDEFKTYASARFATGHGWTYHPTQRHIVLEPDNWATFDELVVNAKYGACRGSGALRRIGPDWKIVQYNLSIPIPNDLADDITARIPRDKGTR